MKYYLLFLFFSFHIMAQEFDYQGNLMDSGLPLPGATICVKKTTRCTATDFDGNYTIRVKKGDWLVISFIGMQTKEVLVTDAFMSTTRGKQPRIQAVNPIENSDFVRMIKPHNQTDTLSIPAGSFNKSKWRYFDNQANYSDYNTIKLIKKDKNAHYQLKYNESYSRLFVQLSNESAYSTPIRLYDYQKSFAQGRNAAYQSGNSNEQFSWGPTVNLLEQSNASNAFYPNGVLVNKGQGNGKAVALFDANDLFQNPYDFKTSLSATIKNPKNDFVKINLTYNRGALVLPTTKNQEIGSSIKTEKNLHNNQKISAQLTYNQFENNFSNFNFGINKVLFANAITPIHFDNQAGFLLPNGAARAFASSVNNPYYLLAYNQDKNESKQLSFSADYAISTNKNNFKSIFTTQQSTIQNSNSNLADTGFGANYNSLIRTENYRLFNFSNVFRHNFKHDKSFIEAKLNYQFQNRDLNRAIAPDASKSIDYKQNRSEWLLNANASHTIDDIFGYYDSLVLTLSSSLQQSSSLKNNVQFGYNGSAHFRNIFNSKHTLYATFMVTPLEPNIQVNNLNFNSLAYKLSDFNKITTTQELLTTNQNVATIEQQTAVGIKSEYYRKIQFSIESFYKKVSNQYAPIFTNNVASWQPAVDYIQKGIEIDVEKRLWNYNSKKIQFGFGVHFSLYRNQVTNLKNNQTSIPIAGFADISKNYIVGQPLGVIVGSGFLRTANNQLVIDSEGFPVIDPNPIIIGNPNPDFILGFNPSFKFNKWQLSLGFDWHQGGQIWNGTQQALNFYGKSLATEQGRATTNFVFEGLTANGQPNTQAIDFYNPQLPLDKNRWQRYGLAGLAEENIEDATYFRLNNISLSYQTKINSLLLKVSVFTNNVFILSKNKTAFIGNSLFNSAETTGLDYFNTPLLSSTGLSFTLNL